MKKYYLIIIMAALLISCKEANKSQEQVTSENTQTEHVANYKSIAVEIEGMTCEIGCAKLIESKLSKMEGVTYSRVDFASKTGQITFDTNKLTAEGISEKIAGIAGGDLYAVVKTTEVDEVNEPSK